MTAIWHAAVMGHNETVRVLGALGADVNIAPAQDGSPLLKSVEEDHPDIARLLRSIEAQLPQHVAVIKCRCVEVLRHGRTWEILQSSVIASQELLQIDFRSIVVHCIMSCSAHSWE